jgi:hypothetical protein
VWQEKNFVTVHRPRMGLDFRVRGESPFLFKCTPPPSQFFGELTMAIGDFVFKEGDGEIGKHGKDGYGYEGHAPQFSVNGTTVILPF